MASEDPISAPALVFRARIAPEMERALKKIKMAWVAGLISAGLTLLVALLALRSGPIMGISAYSLVDAFLILGLTFGIWRKSRTCALIMLLYFIGGKYVQFTVQREAIGSGALSGSVPMALIFLYLYVQGVIGTFSFHRQQKKVTQV